MRFTDRQPAASFTLVPLLFRILMQSTVEQHGNREPDRRASPADVRSILSDDSAASKVSAVSVRLIGMDSRSASPFSGHRDVFGV
jgi:hypothetical protein